MKKAIWGVLTVFLVIRAASGGDVVPDRETWSWVSECQTYHAAFSGTAGVVCHFGDSITYANPYSSWARWGAGKTTADNTILSWIHINQGNTSATPRQPNDFANIKADWNYDGWWLAFFDSASGGSSYTARSGIRSDQYLAGTYTLPPIEDMLDQYNPEIVIVMLGTNDASANRSKADYKTDMENIIKRIIWQNGNTSGPYRGAIPIISTLPHKRGDMTDIANYNDAIRELCAQYHIPMADLYAEIDARQPINWDGTLIDGSDGIHLSSSGGGYNSGSDPRANNYAAIAQVGYLLRCYLSVEKIKSVKAQVIDGTPATLNIVTTSLPDGYVGTPYSQTLAATGGTPPYTWSITSGSISPLTLSSGGVISGTPTTATTYSFTVQVTDTASNTDTQPLTLTITSNGPPQVVACPLVKDTYIESGQTTPYGSLNNMHMGGNNSSPGWVRIALMEFDLSGIPAGSTVNSAILKLYANNDARGGNVSVQGVLQSWTEAGATWTSRDGSTSWAGGNFLASGNWTNATLASYGGRTAGNYTDGSYTLSCIVNGAPPEGSDIDPGYNSAIDDWGGKFIEFDITDLVQNWVSSGANYGLAMCQPGKITRDGGSAWTYYGYSDVAWLTKEFATPGYAPVLTVTYQGGAPDTTAPTVGITAAALTGTVDDSPNSPPAYVYVGGVQVVSSSGTWTSADVALATGNNTIQVTSTDASNNERRVNVEINGIP